MQYRDETMLRELYVDEGLSTNQIAERFDVTNPTILRWLNRHGIETRSPSDAKKERHRSEPATFSTRSTDGYEQWYHRRSVLVHRLQAVALFGLESVKSKHIHHINGIPWDNQPSNLEVMEPRKHHQEHEPRQFDESVAEEIRDQYERQGDMNQYELAEEYGVDQSLISHIVNGKGAYSDS